MPIYEYECRFCRKTFEKVQKITRVQRRVRCECGHMAKRVLSRGAIRCDDAVNIPWLESAKKNLPDSAKHVDTRGGLKKYLKSHDLACVG